MRLWGKRVFALEMLKKLKFYGSASFPPHENSRKRFVLMETIISTRWNPPHNSAFECSFFPGEKKVGGPLLKTDTL
jgi:hypothetical protein